MNDYDDRMPREADLDMPASRKTSRYWRRPKNAPTHPYVKFEGTQLWRTVKKALSDLEKNQDLELKEWHQYVVGYICKQLSRNKLVTRSAKKGRPNKSPETTRGRGP
jgi:hypothetical protein